MAPDPYLSGRPFPQQTAACEAKEVLDERRKMKGPPPGRTRHIYQRLSTAAGVQRDTTHGLGWSPQRLPRDLLVLPCALVLKITPRRPKHARQPSSHDAVHQTTADIKDRPPAPEACASSCLSLMSLCVLLRLAWPRIWVTAVDGSRLQWLCLRRVVWALLSEEKEKKSAPTRNHESLWRLSFETQEDKPAWLLFPLPSGVDAMQSEMENTRPELDLNSMYIS